MTTDQRFYSEIPALNQTHLMDLPGAIETLGYMPAAFKNLAALQKWANNHKMIVEPSKGSISGARFLFSQHPSLTQIWMRAAKSNYRKHAKAMLEELDNGAYSLAEYDVDHVVSRSRVLKIWPDAWVLMQFCDKTINRAVGSKIEKKINYSSLQHVDRIDFGAAQLVKLAATTMRLRGRLAIHATVDGAERSYDTFQVKKTASIQWFTSIRSELTRLGI